SEGTKIGYMESVDRSYREFTGDGSSVTYKMKFDAGSKQNKLVVTVYGKDKGVLNVKVGGEMLKEIELDGTGGDELVDISVDVPKKLTKAKQKGAKIVREDVAISGTPGTRVMEVHVVH
ncbi:MAG: hypothetical protein IJ673_11460, partial [Treponema sp.]|nr:hypothetical protein [Treponema sp.]